MLKPSLSFTALALLYPQGFAYIEFLEAEAVSSAALLEGSELRGRQIKVQAWPEPSLLYHHLLGNHPA